MMDRKNNEGDDPTTSSLLDHILLTEEYIPPARRLYVAALLAGGTVALTLGLTAPFVLSKSALPYMATPGVKLEGALKVIADRLPPRKRTFVDLGSGDGEGVYQASKLGYTSKGYELNYTLYALSQTRRYFFWQSSIRARSSFYRADFFQTTLPVNTNVVMIFGVTPLMVPLSQKLSKELIACSSDNHKYVMSYRFPLPINQSGLLQAKVIYDEEEMRIYKVRGNSK